MTQSSRIAIVYHSPYGHTAVVAEQLALGMRPADAEVALIAVDQMTDTDWEWLDQADCIVMGTPVYMGSMTAPMKAFMDASSRRWAARSWAGKLAAGFANSGGLSGDKLGALQQINLFAMQHGMLWAGMPLMSEGQASTDRNRLGGFLGLMTQSDNATTDITPPEGDRATARWFGHYLARLTATLPAVAKRSLLANDSSFIEP